MVLGNRIKRSLNIIWTGKDLEQNPDENHDPGERQQAPQSVIRTELHLPETLIEEYRAEREQGKENETWKQHFEIAVVFIEIVGVILLFATLCETQRATKAAVDAIVISHDALKEARKATEAAWQSAQADERSAAAAVNQVELAREANKQTREVMELAERPWVSVDVDAAAPLVFNEKGARAMLRFTMKNLGNSPAVSARLKFEILSAWSLQDGVTKQKEICTHLRELTDSGDFTSTILPDGESEEFRALRVRKADVDKGTIQIPGGPSRIMLTIVGCIDYQFTFAKGHHQTGFFFLTVPRGLGINIIDPTKGPYPAKNIRFTSIGGSFAY